MSFLTSKKKYHNILVSIKFAKFKIVSLYSANYFKFNILGFCIVLLILLNINKSIDYVSIKMPDINTKPSQNLKISTSCSEISVLEGDNIHDIFSNKHISIGNLFSIRQDIKSSLNIKRHNNRMLDRLNVGDQLKLCYIPDAVKDYFIVQSIDYHPKDSKKFFYKIYKSKNKYLVTKHGESIVKRVEFVTFNINNSLYQDALEAGLSDYDIMSFADIFQWDVNFLTETRSGDKVFVMFEYEYYKGYKNGNSVILAAEYIARNKSYKSYRYESDGKLVGYFDELGRFKKRRFLRWPVKFTRISSGFNPYRVHPLFKTSRPHRGTDYAAPRHTRVMSVSRGRIIKAGKSRGYGNVVIVDHGNGYTTLYAHLHAFSKGIRKGVHVKQGQVIGYVGSTGWATGPHLHYEFRVRGRHKNPVTVRLPGNPPIPKHKLKKFMKTISPIKHEYSLRKKAVLLQ